MGDNSSRISTAVSCEKLISCRWRSLFWAGMSLNWCCAVLPLPASQVFFGFKHQIQWLNIHHLNCLSLEPLGVFFSHLKTEVYFFLLSSFPYPVSSWALWRRGEPPIRCKVEHDGYITSNVVRDKKMTNRSEIRTLHVLFLVKVCASCQKASWLCTLIS